MTVTRTLHLCLSPWNRLSSPMERSKRLLGAMRGGFLSSSSVPGAGTFMSDDPYIDAGQILAPRAEVNGVPAGFVADGGAGREEPQKRPAWNCWSALRMEAST